MGNDEAEALGWDGIPKEAHAKASAGIHSKCLCLESSPSVCSETSVAETSDVKPAYFEVACPNSGSHRLSSDVEKVRRHTRNVCGMVGDESENKSKALQCFISGVTHVSHMRSDSAVERPPDLIMPNSRCSRSTSHLMVDGISENTDKIEAINLMQDEPAVKAVVSHSSVNGESEVVQGTSIDNTEVENNAPENLKEKQDRDPQLKIFKDWKVNYENKPDWQDVAPHSLEVKYYWYRWDQLEVRNGILYRRWLNEANGSVKWLIVLPKELRHSVLIQLHDRSNWWTSRCKENFGKSS